MKILDTFAGIGGFSYAAEKLIGGFETTQFVEIDPYCQKVLQKHWPHVPIHDDIRTFTARPFQWDVICAGFPCQDISVLRGFKKGITQESRSGLFYELMRVIRMVRPKYIILENVAAILNNGLDIVLGELSEAGYDAEWAVISASSLGACHRRSRWWLVAYPNNNGQQRRLKHATKLLQGKTHRSSGQPIQVSLSDAIMMEKIKENPELMEIYQDHQMEERPYLPKQEEFVTYLRQQTTIKELTAKTTIKKTTIEHWFRKDKAGFSYPSIENWEEIKPHLKTIQFDKEMTTTKTKEWTTKSQMLPTPTTMDYLPQRSVNSMLKQVTEHRKGRTNLANLREAVNPQAVELFNHLQSLPTPTAREWKDGSSQSLKNCKKQHTLGRAIHHTYPQNGDHMYLNPCFCEEMMGFEIGWTDLEH